MIADKADVIIIGAGLAGIVTAIDLLSAGKKVLLLDRDVEENLGGLARESFGGMFFVDSPLQRKNGIRDSAELAFDDWCRFAEFDAADQIPRQWAEHYVNKNMPMIYEWLTGYGISFLPVVNWVERGMYRPGNSVPRFHIVWGTGQGLTTTLIDVLSQHPNRSNLEMKFDHKVTTLEQTAGKISGCSGEVGDNNGSFDYQADTVVIAAGGINGSDEMIRKHWHSDWGEVPPQIILNGSHKYADGLLHQQILKQGARVTHLDNMWNYAAGVHHPRPRKPRHGLSLVPSKTALWLDAHGRRFGPEPLVAGFDTRELVTRVCQQSHKYSWQIMNYRIALKEMAISGAESNPAIRDRKKLQLLKTILFGNKPLVDDMIDNCIDFVTANSVAELAEKMNAMGNPVAVDAAGMEKDISDYDAQWDRPAKFRNDDQIRRITHLRQHKGDALRMVKEQRIVDPKALPLIAIREFIVSRKSLGGIQTDLQSRVLDPSGAVMDGLYAVGEAAGFGGGGVHGKRALEGTFLGGCVLTARMAAKSIAGQ